MCVKHSFPHDEMVSEVRYNSIWRYCGVLCVVAFVICVSVCAERRTGTPAVPRAETPGPAGRG